MEKTEAGGPRSVVRGMSHFSCFSCAASRPGTGPASRPRRPDARTRQRQLLRAPNPERKWRGQQKVGSQQDAAGFRAASSSRSRNGTGQRPSTVWGQERRGWIRRGGSSGSRYKKVLYSFSPQARRPSRGRHQGSLAVAEGEGGDRARHLSSLGLRRGVRRCSRPKRRGPHGPNAGRASRRFPRSRKGTTTTRSGAGPRARERSARCRSPVPCQCLVEDYRNVLPSSTPGRGTTGRCRAGIHRLRKRTAHLSAAGHTPRPAGRASEPARTRREKGSELRASGEEVHLAQTGPSPPPSAQVTTSGRLPGVGEGPRRGDLRREETADAAGSRGGEGKGGGAGDCLLPPSNGWSLSLPGSRGDGGAGEAPVGHSVGTGCQREARQSEDALSGPKCRSVTRGRAKERKTTDGRPRRRAGDLARAVRRPKRHGRLVSLANRDEKGLASSAHRRRAPGEIWRRRRDSTRPVRSRPRCCHPGVASSPRSTSLRIRESSRRAPAFHDAAGSQSTSSTRALIKPSPNLATMGELGRLRRRNRLTLTVAISYSPRGSPGISLSRPRKHRGGRSEWPGSACRATPGMTPYPQIVSPGQAQASPRPAVVDPRIASQSTSRCPGQAKRPPAVGRTRVGPCPAERDSR